MPAIVTVALFAFITSWNEFLGAIVMMSKESAFTLPVILATARTETSLGGTDWGMLQAGVTISIIPCVARLPAAAALLRVRACSAEPSSDPRVDARPPRAATADRRATASVVRPTAGALGRLRPLGAAQVRLDGGFWGDRQAINRSRTIPHGFAQLRPPGTLDNLRLAAGAERRRTRPSATRPVRRSRSSTPTSTSGSRPSAGSSAARRDPALAATADEAIALVAAAQRPDGYLNSYVQVVAGGEPFRDLAWGHELYCIGHLIQAAVAWHRALGDDRLLDVATPGGRRASTGRSGRAGATASTATRRSRWRWSSCSG